MRGTRSQTRWLGVLIPAAATLIFADAILSDRPRDLLMLIVGISGVMVGLARQQAPAEEAYRLGRIGGAREQREACARTCGSGCVEILAATGTDTRRPSAPAAYRRRLTVIRR